MEQYTKDLIDVGTKVGQLLLLLIAAGWAYFRLWREGVLRTRVDFRIECNFFGPHGGEYIVEFLLLANNRGLVIQTFPSINLKLRAIRSQDKLAPWDKYPDRVQFPEKLLDTEVVHEKYGHIFVEPGVEQVITFVAKIPADVRFILARAEFVYSNSNPHSAERVFEVPKLSQS
jgi:hypothetical protein